MAADDLDGDQAARHIRGRQRLQLSVEVDDERVAQEGERALAFLRNTLIINLDAQLEALAPTDVASGLITIEVVGGQATFSEKPDAPSTQYFVALYDSVGELRAWAGGGGDDAPAFPAVHTLEKTVAEGTTPFVLPSADGGPVFHASAAYYEIDGVSEGFTQMVALPLASINQVVASYIGIYGILALTRRHRERGHHALARDADVPEPRSGGVDRRRRSPPATSASA